MNESLIKDIGRSYIISSLLPASFFVLLAVFIFRDFLPAFNDFIAQNSSTAQAPAVVLSSGILVLAFSMWIAFMLYSSVDYVIKVYEGDYLYIVGIPLQYLQYLRQRWRLKTYFYYKKQKEKVIPAISDKDERDAAKDRLDQTSRDDAQKQIHQHEISGPIYDNWRFFKPTSLGNILAASEYYPSEKYSLNGPMLFPRMSMVFPPEFTSSFEEKNNQLLFILNSSLLSYLIGFIALILGWARNTNFSIWWHPIILEIYHNYLEAGYKGTSNNHYVIVGVFFIVLGYGIYRMSINTVKEYALFVRAGFDLYRFDILRELNHPIPASLTEERKVWKVLSEFLLEGDIFGENKFDYQLKPELSEMVAKESTTKKKSNKK